MKYEIVVEYKMTANVLVEADDSDTAEHLAKEAVLEYLSEDPDALPFDYGITYGPEFKDNSIRAVGESGNDAEAVSKLYG